MTILFSTYFIHFVPLSFRNTSHRAPFYSQFKHSFYGRFDARRNVHRKPRISFQNTILWKAKKKKKGKKKEKREKNIVNDFAIFLQSSIPLSFKYSHFYNDSQIRHMHKSKARVYKNFIEICFFLSLTRGWDLFVACKTYSVLYFLQTALPIRFASPFALPNR